MSDNQIVDEAHLVAQIQTLKTQRSNAMDDVAVLMGQVESLKAKIVKLEEAQNGSKDISSPEDTESSVG